MTAAAPHHESGYGHGHGTSNVVTAQVQKKTRFSGPILSSNVVIFGRRTFGSDEPPGSNGMLTGHEGGRRLDAPDTVPHGSATWRPPITTGYCVRVTI